MERERPDYLPPIEGRRWEFPWLLVIGVILIAVMGGGVAMLTRTHAAWSDRFERRQPVQPMQPAPDPVMSAQFKADHLNEIKRRRTLAETEAKHAERKMRGQEDTDELRCIGGVVFRRIPGGWENVPSEHC